MDLGPLKYKYALDHAAIVAVTNRAGDITYVNDQFCTISKYSRDELLGKNHRLINSGHHPREYFSEMWNTISNGKIWEGEIRNRAKDGTYYWVSTTIVPFLNSKDEPDEYISIRYDVTQRKEMEAQLLHQDRLASIGLLVSSLAHEIGTPLGVIRGRAEYLGMQAPPDSSMRAGLDVITSQIDRISKLIQSLLNLTRSSPSSEVRPVVVAQIVDHIGAFLAHEFKKRDIDFQTEVSSTDQVKAEPEQLEQVLLNLMMNAIHAIDSAKQSGRDGHRIRVSTLRQGKNVEISVHDTGCGISEQNRQHLFKPFFTTKDIGVGTGLGLAIAYKIIQSWGGSIHVESQQGVGTTFRVVLPQAG